MRNHQSLTVCTDKRLTPIIGNTCREIRERNGVTLNKLSELIHTPYNTLNAFENGKSRNGHIIFAYMSVFANDLLTYDFSDFTAALNEYQEEY